MQRSLLVVLVTALALLALAAPASAALTGNWSGKTKQDLGLDQPYKTSIVFGVLNGRIVSLFAEVRLLCGESSVTDARVSKTYRVGKGPKLSSKGGFGFTVQGVRIDGRLGAKAGAGTISASKSGCQGAGDWTVKRRRI